VYHREGFMKSCTAILVLLTAHCQGVEHDGAAAQQVHDGELTRYFDANLKGPGLWKWRHYLPIYEKYFAKFKGTDVHFVEIGIFSGGGLRMWRSYFGPRAHIYGVDISNRTRIYEGNPLYGTPDRIFVGDQASPRFWERFKLEVPRVDVLLDDGGHQAFQQIATLNALWDHLAPGGIHVVEDLQRANGSFVEYVVDRFINGGTGINSYPLPTKRVKRISMEMRTTESVAFYPYMAVLQKSSHIVQGGQRTAIDNTRKIRVEKHGDIWQPPAFWSDHRRAGGK
jgi:hypothetical protein